jgi:hypothetical protein
VVALLEDEMSDKMSEFERFCESYIQAAEEEWDKSEDAVDMTADTVAKIMLDKYRQCHEATEPKDCGFTLATCPYERCSGITMRDPKAEEPMLKTPSEFEKVFQENVGKMYATGAEQINIEEPLAVKEPHIICLAAAKHYRIRPAMTAKAWIISLVKIGDRNDKFVAKGETYWEAERQARAFLMGLPDKGEMK